MTALRSVLVASAVFYAALHLLTLRDPAFSPALRRKTPCAVTRRLSAVVYRAMSLLRPRSEPHVWEEVFYSLAFHLRAGEALPQAIRAVSEESASTAHEALRRVVRAYEAGATLAQAFQTQAGGGEMERLAATVETGLASGSDLPALLCHSAEVLSRKRSLVKEAQAKLTESRLTAVLLTALPWVIAAITYSYDPALMAQGLSSPRGRLIMMASFCLWITGVALVILALSSVTRGRGE